MIGHRHHGAVEHTLAATHTTADIAHDSIPLPPRRSVLLRVGAQKSPPQQKDFCLTLPAKKITDTSFPERHCSLRGIGKALRQSGRQPLQARLRSGADKHSHSADMGIMD